jgi:ribose 1,5-bisphosphokinase PhnN
MRRKATENRRDVGFLEPFRQLSSVEIRRPTRILPLRRSFSVVIVGGTCAGKSTLAHSAVADPTLANRYEVARRYSTREPRQGDTTDGMTSIHWDEFNARVANNGFELSWERPVPGNQLIGYGCAITASRMIPILMAGHGIYTNVESVHPRDALDTALIIGVYAPTQVRAKRLDLRSPDVIERDPVLAQALLVHDDAAMANSVDLIVHNYGLYEATSVGDFIHVLTLLLDATDSGPAP